MSHGLDYLQQYRQIHAQIMALNPRAVVPDESKGIIALQQARDILFKLQNPAPAALTQADRDFSRANELQTEVATVLARYVDRGIVNREDFPFPDSECEDRIAYLQNMRSRIHEAVAEYNLPAEARAKRTEKEFRAFRSEVLFRLSAIEQELSHT